MSTDPPAIEVPPRVLDYLRGQNILSLATASPTGVPHAATLVYVQDGLTLYFWSRPGTRTAQHIEANPHVAFTIGDYCADWSKTKGIQGSGECHVLLGPDEIRRVTDLFRNKFPALTAVRTANLAFFRINLSQLQFIDNESAGGEKSEQTLGADYHRSLVYSVFRGLPVQEVETVAATLDTIQIESGATIVRQGAPADKFFIIVSGEVEVVHEEAGEARRVAVLKAGQFFGEIAILRDTPRTATVRALTPTVLLTMDRDAFRGLVAQSLATTQDFDDAIRERLETMAAGASR